MPCFFSLSVALVCQQCETIARAEPENAYPRIHGWTLCSHEAASRQAPQFPASLARYSLPKGSRARVVRRIFLIQIRSGIVGFLGSALAPEPPLRALGANALHPLQPYNRYPLQ